MNSSTEANFNIDQALQKAVHFHKAGRLQQAEEIYHHILHIKPGHADALHLLGLVHGAKGAIQKAKQLIRQAIENDLHMPIFYVSYGDILQREKNYTKAIDYYRTALIMNPNLLQALCNLGNILSETGNHEEAVGCYKKAITINPKLPEAFNNLGLAYQHQKQYESSKDCFKKAIALNKHYFEAYNNLGNLYRDLEEFELAISHYQQALCLAPENTAVNYNIGLVYQKLKKSDKAVPFYYKAIKHSPPMADAHNNLGKYYQDLNLPDKALYHYDKAIELDPKHADAHFNRSLSLLTIGNFEAGWQAYEWRFKLKNWRRIYPHRLTGPQWNGEKFIEKTLFIHSEQGFGDIIWLARYLPHIKPLGGKIIFETRVELKELLQNVAGIDQVIPMSFKQAPEISYDMYAPLMSLPRILKTTIDTIPATIPYLKGDKAKQAHWATRIETKGIKIGLVWAAKTITEYEKSCDLKNFLPLFKNKNVYFYGLQKGKEASQADKISKQIVNFGPDFETFADTAGVIENLDLIISVDTAVAHLAGAMGKPVWVLLSYGADCRWLMERTDSPWYPTMRLFRQSKPSDWTSVIKKISSCLQQWIASKK
jgi:tetratricopeptide (TPR) repeat protein